MLPTYTYFRDGYWFAVVSEPHWLKGTKCMAKKKRTALRLLNSALAEFPESDPDSERTASSRSVGHLAHRVTEMVSESLAALA